MRFPYFEATIEVPGGTSGGPVFDQKGRVVGLNCRGWDFRGAEHEDAPLSYMVPIEHLLELPVDPFLVPPSSWEADQIPAEKKGQRQLTVRELGLFGHVVFDPPVR